MVIKVKDKRLMRGLEKSREESNSNRLLNNLNSPFSGITTLKNQVCVIPNS
jgi:hypothetical protein